MIFMIFVSSAQAWLVPRLLHILLLKALKLHLLIGNILKKGA
ncbi:hypothetical protein BMETH_39_2 [methanotrophic bacterial endosymbiont of Bathymodiolus sp.]|nr:hypothetical protein BMETH_39_2 [methanotrophic bacterial endosymbiont of Bathymodiolus sp.]